ncbi:hypothetical protein U1Q18_031885, partial [Sarracenia purpurea var. burkii]
IDGDASIIDGKCSGSTAIVHSSSSSDSTDSIGFDDLGFVNFVISSEQRINSEVRLAISEMTAMNIVYGKGRGGL